MIKIRFPLTSADKDYPFIFASFFTKNRVKIGGALLVDTASMHNILNWKLFGLLYNPLKEFSGDIALTSFRGVSVKANKVRFSFSVNGISFEEDFYMSNDLSLDYVYENHIVVGVIGVDFLRKYRLSLDFVKGLLVSTGQKLEEICKLPLQYGFSKYGLPVIIANNRGRKYGCLLDSGSCFNITTRYVLDNYGICHTQIKKGQPFKSITRTVDADEIRAKIKLVGMDYESRLHVKYSFDEMFQIMKEDYHIVDGSDGIPPISMILGVHFLKKNGCVIDFDKKYLYVLNSTNTFY